MATWRPASASPVLVVRHVSEMATGSNLDKFLKRKYLFCVVSYGNGGQHLHYDHFLWNVFSPWHFNIYPFRALNCPGQAHFELG